VAAVVAREDERPAGLDARIIGGGAGRSRGGDRDTDTDTEEAATPHCWSPYDDAFADAMRRFGRHRSRIVHDATIRPKEVSLHTQRGGSLDRLQGRAFSLR